MSDPKGPYIVRPARPEYFAKPGLHSHNRIRRKLSVKRAFNALGGVRLMLLLIGIAGIGYYGYTLADQYVYEAYQNWAFDQEIAGRAGVTFADYVRERTPFGFLAGESSVHSTASTTANSKEPPSVMRPAEGSVLGRVEIARLNLAAVVREGVDAKVLSVAVGHVPSTALPGQSGNFAIAAHRDTLFRVLKDIRPGDLVSFESPNATYRYKVAATKIVRPTDVSVLQADGGGMIPHTEMVGTGTQPGKLLTMITCYPFYYVGSAPKRFIVEAELVSDANTAEASPNASPSQAPNEAMSSSGQHIARKKTVRADMTRPRRAKSVLHGALRRA